MDLKGWTKESEDEKTATLKHPKGHTMVIALKSLPKIQREAIARLKMADGGMARKMYADSDEPVANDDQAPTENIPSIQDNPAVGNFAKPIAVPAENQPNVPQEIPNVDPRTGQPNPNANIQNSINAEKLQRDIDIQKAKAQLENEQKYMAAQAQLEQQRQDNIQKNLVAPTEAFRNYINGVDEQGRPTGTKLNPKAYQENMSTGSKIAAGLGLFMGGLGTPFGGHNYAMDMLNNQIDRDINAQIKRGDQQKTVLGAYQQLYGDKNLALTATKMSLLDAYDHQAKQIGLQLATPQAQAQYLRLSSDVAQQKQKLAKDTAALIPVVAGYKPIGGTQPSGAQQNGNNHPPKKEEKHPFRETILTPDADQKMKNIQYTLHSKGLDNDYEPLMAEYSQAKNADASLGEVNQAYQELSQIADEGGAQMRAMLNGKHSVSALAGGIGAVFGHGPAAAAGAEGALSGVSTDLMRRYESAQGRLKSALSSATKGTNLGSQDLDALTRQNTPVYGDERRTRADKLNSIRKPIINHANRGYLIKHGLSKPE